VEQGNVIARLGGMRHPWRLWVIGTVPGAVIAVVGLVVPRDDALDPFTAVTLPALLVLGRVRTSHYGYSVWLTSRRGATLAN
jgi:hypothetical protein